MNTPPADTDVPASPNPLTHLDDHGRAAMVDVGAKPETPRRAVAVGHLAMGASAMAQVLDGRNAKGDLLAVARVAGVMAAKRTSDLIPLCHPLPLTSVSVEFEASPAAGRVEVRATAETVGRTGVEMEALCAASLALLTLYDMLKAVDKTMAMGGVRVVRKEGGRSGTWIAEKPGSRGPDN